MKVKKIFNKYKILFAALVIVGGIFLPAKFPYINLFTQQIDIVVIWLSTLILFGFKWKYLFLSGVCLLILIGGLTLFNKGYIAELLGNSTFFIFLTAALLLFIEDIKNQK